MSAPIPNTISVFKRGERDVDKFSTASWSLTKVAKLLKDHRGKAIRLFQRQSSTTSALSRGPHVQYFIDYGPSLGLSVSQINEALGAKRGVISAGEVSNIMEFSAITGIMEKTKAKGARGVKRERAVTASVETDIAESKMSREHFENTFLPSLANGVLRTPHMKVHIARLANIALLNAGKVAERVALENAQAAGNQVSQAMVDAVRKAEEQLKRDAINGARNLLFAEFYATVREELITQIRHVRVRRNGGELVISAEANGTFKHVASTSAAVADEFEAWRRNNGFNSRLIEKVYNGKEKKGLHWEVISFVNWVKHLNEHRLHGVPIDGYIAVKQDVMYRNQDKDVNDKAIAIRDEGKKAMERKIARMSAGLA